MIELPEAAALAAQAATTLVGRTVLEAEVNHSPHKLTWFAGDATSYRDRLVSRTVTGASGVAGHVQLDLGDWRLLLNDGAYPRWYAPGEPLPAKHQLRLDLDDGSALVVSVAMHGGIQVFAGGTNQNPYYLAARTKPSPLTSTFDEDWFGSLLAADGADRLSAKAFLATEQRIPGLGNGVLQDILWTARVHPRRKVGAMSDAERAALYDAVVGTVRAMTDGGGRDTERTLFGRPGGYPTVMSRSTLELPCPRCGGRRVKEAYLGGAVYFCPGCQVA